ncbi:MAG: hypothetical protein NT062_09080, partial [Proteobacteria bacterium]|nr:hypothetical protein [Pseudomonadota bacterium]
MTRHNRAKTAATEAIKPIDADAEVVVPVVKVTRTLRAADSDDHLAAYFRQLAAHELLTPEDERELSQGIEDTEVLTWERVLSRPDVVVHLLALIEPNFDQPVKFPKLLKAVEELAGKPKKARKEPKVVKKF